MLFINHEHTYDNAYLHAIKRLSVSITRASTVWQAWRAAIYKIRLRYRTPLRFYLSPASYFDGKSRTKKKGETEGEKERESDWKRTSYSPFCSAGKLFRDECFFFFSTCRCNVIDIEKFVRGQRIINRRNEVRMISISTKRIYRAKPKIWNIYKISRIRSCWESLINVENGGENLSHPCWE